MIARLLCMLLGHIPERLLEHTIPGGEGHQPHRCKRCEHRIAPQVDDWVLYDDLWPKNCTTCGQRYSRDAFSVCSNSFHCCRDCVWVNGRREWTCDWHWYD